MAIRWYGLGRLLGVSFALLVAGCSWMPNQGPTVREIDTNSGVDKDFVVVKLSPDVMSRLGAVPKPSLLKTFGDNRPAPTRTISRGDLVSVAIWEAGGAANGGTGTPDTLVQIGIQSNVVPPQTVDPKGDITVPFVGQVHAAGKSTVEVQREIVRRMQGQAIKPQALVSIVSDQSNLISVIGDVKKPDQYVLNVNGMRVLDAVAKAGGTVSPAFDTVVQLTRFGVQKRVRLSDLITHPADNIYLEPGDVLYLLHDPEFVAVLGATKNNMRVEFDAERLTLAEVLGQSGGLVDVQAEPTGVYVLRFVPSDIVGSLTGKPFTAGQKNAGLIPVLFQDDMREPQGFFLAQSFDMQNKDIIFVANTESVQVGKVLQLMVQAAAVIGILSGSSSSVAAP
jgi:polysaccharide biosynthesis/export protein